MKCMINRILLLLTISLLATSCSDYEIIPGLGIEPIGFIDSRRKISNKEQELYFTWTTSNHWEIVSYMEIIGKDTVRHYIGGNTCIDNRKIKGNWFSTEINNKLIVKINENLSVEDREIVFDMSGSNASGFISIIQAGSD